MKALLFAFLSLPALAADLPPELARPAATYQAGLNAAETTRSAAKAPLDAAYEAALSAAEKSALSTRDLKPVAAIAAEREALKAGDLPANAPLDLPKATLVARKNYATALLRVEAEAKERRERVAADYLKELLAVQARPTTNAALSAQIDAEKERVLHSASLGLLKRKLAGTKWKAEKGTNTFTLNADGTIHASWGASGTWDVKSDNQFELQWNQREREAWRLDDHATTLKSAAGKFVFKRIE